MITSWIGIIFCVVLVIHFAILMSILLNFNNYSRRKVVTLTALVIVSFLLSSIVLGGLITEEIQEQALACEEACYAIYNGTMTYEEAWQECNMNDCKLEYCSQYGSMDGATHHCGIEALD